MINFNKPSFGTEKILLITSDNLTPPTPVIDYYRLSFIVVIVIIDFFSAHLNPQSSLCQC